MVNVRKRGKVYEYRVEIAPVEGKRKWISKSGFKSKAEAEKEGIKPYNEYMETGNSFVPSTMSYSDYLDYWLKEHCEINLKYHTIQAYRNIIKNHIKPNLGFYRLSQISTATLQEFINKIYVDKGFSKNFLKNILKVRLPKYDTPDPDPAHIFTKEEIDMILNRFTKKHAFYYAVLTAYYTGLIVSEVFGLTWDDIDLENKTLTVNKNIIEKNQSGSTHGRHISGKAKTVWYFGTCKTPSSYRTIDIGDTLVEALKKFKKEQEEEYGDSYMKHYGKQDNNPYTNKPEIKILNALAEIDVALPEVNLVFVKDNGVFEGTATVKYPFKVIHYELGISCRFHDFRDAHATKLIQEGADIKAVAKRLGHSSIETTYNIYVRVTEKMKNDAVENLKNMQRIFNNIFNRK